MTKTEISNFFKAINNNDLESVKTFINKDKAYTLVYNGPTPKKDAGQSGLQVALKNSNFEIAKYLIEQGSDVNFIEDINIGISPLPVLHDCIRKVFTYTMYKDITYYDMALSLLKMMLSKGANPNAVDFHGNNSLNRAILDTSHMVTYPNFEEMKEIAINKFRNIFEILVEAGADINESNSKRESAINNIKKFGLEEYNLIK